MSEDIRVMTAQLAADPASLVFLPLGEALRQRRQLDAAERVVVAGLNRYPDLADAHDLYARILGDQGDFERAFDEWGIALANDPDHSGAHKGIGYLYFVAGQLEQALQHLRRAAELDPTDEGIAAAISRVTEAMGSAGGQQTPTQPPAAPAPPAEERQPTPVPAVGSSAAEPRAGFEGADQGLLLVDKQGRLLAGRLADPAAPGSSDAVAAHLAGVGSEAARATRILGLGVWQAVTAQGEDASLHLTSPTAETILLIVREPDLPLGRLAVQAGKATDSARDWLESLK